MLVRISRDLSPACSKTRACPDFSDGQFLATGLLLPLSLQESGRDSLQRLLEVHQVENVERSQSFETLKSKRRLGFLREICALLKQTSEPKLSAKYAFASIPELDGREIFVAIGHFYAINLRTYWLAYMDMDMDLGLEGTKDQHDIKVLKRVSEQLGGKKDALWIWDKAEIDGKYYHNNKNPWRLFLALRQVCWTGSTDFRRLGVPEVDFSLPG